MKLMVFIAVLVMAGCSATTPISELEDEALRTGDWSSVERRERAIARRKAEEPTNCGLRNVEYCSGPPGALNCYCVKKKTMRNVLPRGM